MGKWTLVLYYLSRTLHYPHPVQSLLWRCSTSVCVSTVYGPWRCSTSVCVHCLGTLEVFYQCVCLLSAPPLSTVQSGPVSQLALMHIFQHLHNFSTILNFSHLSHKSVNCAYHFPSLFFHTSQHFPKGGATLQLIWSSKTNPCALTSFFW